MSSVWLLAVLLYVRIQPIPVSASVRDYFDNAQWSFSTPFRNGIQAIQLTRYHREWDSEPCTFNYCGPYYKISYYCSLTSQCGERMRSIDTSFCGFDEETSCETVEGLQGSLENGHIVYDHKHHSSLWLPLFWANVGHRMYCAHMPSGSVLCTIEFEHSKESRIGTLAERATLKQIE